MTPRSEDGAGVALVLGLVAALIGVACLAGGGAALVVGHRRAQAAADLAALAAATELQEGGDACGAARRIAEANGAETEECAVHGSEAVVTVKVSAPEVLGSRALRARARAGPASADVAEHPGDLDP